MTATSTVENGINNIASLTPEAKEILHHSIIQYLHRNGFSKTLKRFQSEAQIQNDTWKDSSANLEEIYCKYIDECRHTKEDIGDAKKDGKDLDVADEKTTTSKKKKSSVESNNGGEIAKDNVVEPETKGKKKKKSKGDLTEEAQLDAPEIPVNDTMNGLEVNELKKKSKDKKKKSKQEEVFDEIKSVTYKVENGDVHPDVAKEEKKSSKKRKRLLSDENERQADKTETNKTIEESKRQKTEASKDDVVAESGSYDTSDKQLNGGEKSESQKSAKKQRNGSAEPKTINAFQRVKIDEVEFAHEKLQDNSYWAKDGADVGYGAKAQEVLGQVRGRDFRHEKTKKKRGSYRGGQIDLQSHSIKFNYSDED